MPQGPIAVKVSAPSFGLTDVTAAAALKAHPGVLATVIVVVAGSGGSLTFNNCTTTGGATAGNTIFTAANSALSVGQILNFNFPCNVGITLSAITTGGKVSIAYS